MTTKTNSDLGFYVSNVWRMLFEATREEDGWEAITDPARLSRIREMASSLGRDLDFDLDSAQAAVDAHQNRDQWKASLT